MNLRRTPLFEEHLKLHGKMVPFAGWEMPVQYSGVIDEHRAVRERVGFFDVSHMGELVVRGPQSREFLDYYTPNAVQALIPGKAHYSLLLRENGAPVDDIIIYCLADDDFLICVNASNTEKDFQWLKTHERSGVTIENRSSFYAQIAVQGPVAIELISQFLDEPSFSSGCSYFSFVTRSHAIAGDAIIARTGYTGEDGVEIFLSATQSPRVWNELLRIGEGFGALPAGLAARDTLRLEAAMPLYGHELNDDTDVISAGLGWVVKLDKGDFIGREALLQVKERGPVQKLVGLEIVEPGIVREGSAIFGHAEKPIGVVTSGTKTPSLPAPIAMGYVPAELAALGTELFCEVRGRKIRTRVVKRPFYKRAK